MNNWIIFRDEEYALILILFKTFTVKLDHHKSIGDCKIYGYLRIRKIIEIQLQSSTGSVGPSCKGCNFPSTAVPKVTWVKPPLGE